MSIYSDLIYLSGSEARESDGTGNNLLNDEQGSAGQQLIRITYADYEDGVGTPEDRGNAREISNAMADIPDGTPNSFGSSQMFIFFGQFIDHDIDIVGEDHAAGEMITVVPDGDPSFPDGAHLTLGRSAVAPGTGTGGTPREHVNNITSYLDASNVYGSSQATTDVLRDGAYMITNSHGGAATVGDIEAVHGHGSANGLFLGNPATAHVLGDIRSDENIALTSIHEIWMKEHNFQVDRLKDMNLGLSDEELFQTARMIVEAEYQKVVYDEWLPELIGHALPGYTGYNPHVDASISNEFAGAAFRFGHTMLPTDFERLTEDGSTTQHLGLFDTFFQPHKLDQAGGVSALVRGLAADATSEFDAKIIDDVRNLLFGPDSFRDLATLNIMRGRDQGVPTLNEVRVDLGFDAYTSFDDLTSDAALAAALSQAYGGDINKVDLWVGILAEDKVDGTQVGETLQYILVDQFARLRDGDRFYYENRLADTPDLLAEIQSSSFSEIIARNTDIDHLQENIFKAYERLVGDDYDNDIFGGDDSDLIVGLGGNDTLHGGGANDEIYGGDGNDDMFGDGGHDAIFGEDGYDFILAGNGSDHVEGGAGSDRIFLQNGHDYAQGGSGNDAIYGGAHNDVIGGGSGNDVIRGGTQHDRLFGDSGQDRLFGDQGIDRLYGDAGSDKMYGGADRDYLYGGAGNDRIYGQGGNDKIDGGSGFDKLYGGAGRDEFNMGHNMGTDQVYGFNINQDKLNIGSHFHSMQQVYNNAYDSRSGAVIDFGGGDKVLLVGISLSDLDATNFKFGNF
ncbi:MAG: peroxidase [Alphaproteobacteria bacterium]|nr:peroxidase [Alphaproteobacteria bacterium]